MGLDNIKKGFEIGIGIMLFFGFLFGIVYASGWHTANEIISGTFLGNYTFNGTVDFNNATVSGISGRTNTNDIINIISTLKAGNFSYTNIENGFVDAFNDESGIDTGTSTNQTYDATNDLYSNGGLSTLITGGTGTTIGDLTGNGGLAAAFDGNLVQLDTVSARKGGGPGFGSVGKDWGSGNTKTITKFDVYAPTNLNLVDALVPTNIDIRLQGSTDNFSSSIVDLYVDTSYSSSAAGILTVTSGITMTTAYRYHRILITLSGNNILVAELQFYNIATVTNMTLISNATTALSIPSSSSIVIEEEDVDNVTLNSDLIAYASRDNGTTWSSGTLSVATNLTTGRILTSTIDLSSQPSGSLMRYKLITNNSKSLKLHGVGMTWS